MARNWWKRRQELPEEQHPSTTSGFMSMQLSRRVSSTTKLTPSKTWKAWDVCRRRRRCRRCRRCLGRCRWRLCRGWSKAGQFWLKNVEIQSRKASWEFNRKVNLLNLLIQNTPNFFFQIKKSSTVKNRLIRKLNRTTSNIKKPLVVEHGMIRTRGCWVRNENATLVLCRP